ncbi:DUF6520 family protein [Zhouia sp. PK063]|uniref:DUF6520 family protein n=1 Tax=Zhouia sp. PK063 TaxID=3373602 RepID=UPI0037B026CB
MKKLKVSLPFMAIVMAIGLSFATVHHTSSAVSGYVNDPILGWTAVDVACNPGSNNCQVQFVDEEGTPQGSPLNVYAEEDEDSTPLPSSSTEPVTIER